MDALSPIKLAQDAAKQVGDVIMPTQSEEAIKSSKPRKPKAKQAHVDIYSEFFGVITPLASPSEDPESYLHSLQGIKRQPDEYNWRIKDGYLISDSMLRVFRSLINNGYVHWHWLSTWWMYNANFDEVCGFDSSLTDSRDMIAGEKDKMRYMKKVVKREGRHDKRKHNVIWIDPGFGPERDSWHRIAGQVHDAHFKMIKITCSGGLRSTETSYIDTFSRDSLTKKPRDKNGKAIKPSYGVKFYSSLHRRVVTFDGRRLPNEIQLDGRESLEEAIRK